jgi:hypothetical protein
VECQCREQDRLRSPLVFDGTENGITVGMDGGHTHFLIGAQFQTAQLAQERALELFDALLSGRVVVASFWDQDTCGVLSFINPEDVAVLMMTRGGLALRIRSWGGSGDLDIPAEQIAALEPPPPVSSSVGLVHRTLDSLPAPDPGGGR